MKLLVTGSAGFIGYHVVERLLARGDEVVGLDNINDYYDVRLKYDRLRRHGVDAEPQPAGSRPLASATHPGYRFVRADLADAAVLENLFAAEGFDRVCHLAAQAGVRYSLTNPGAYVQSNLVGFSNIVEACRRHGCRHLVYASSSSVYGLNERLPFSVHDNVDHPVSLYAASKKANELVAHAYSRLFGLPTTGLRFFTVYGPWGRPDMALFLFTRAILEGRPIQVFNHGNMSRDFTYIDDIVEGVLRVIDSAPAGDPSWSGARPDPAGSPAPYRVYNIGRGRPVRLLDFIDEIEKQLGRTAIKEMLPMQSGDVAATAADVSDLERDLGYCPATSVPEGIALFIAWYREYFGGDHGKIVGSSGGV